MPFIIKKSDSCPASRPYGVFTETAHGSGVSKGHPHGCFPSEAAAREQQKALYANVPEAKSEAPPPPNLRESDSTTECCGTCKMFDEGKCWGYGNVDVQPDQVCDSYSPEPTTEAKSEVPMTVTALTPHTIEWRRERARALSESQRKRPESREVHEPLELRAADSNGTRTLRSYASLFNEPYMVRAAGYRFEETIKPGAFKRTLGTNPDVVFRYDHSGPPLARTSSGTLRLGEDDKGLWYEADLNPEDPDVKALVPKIERGDLSESSFAFRIGHNGDKWNDEHDHRDILACELDRGDVSVVTFGASRATGKHMLLRSEEAMVALQEIGFERFVAAWLEWRDWSLLPTEERLGKVISSSSMETLRQVLSLISNAEDSMDEAEAMLSDFLDIPKSVDEDAKGGKATDAEQLDHVGRSEEETRDDPSYEDYDVMYGLKNAKLALSAVKACQLCDPGNDTDPDDKSVMAAIEDAEAAIDKAIVAQAQDGRRDDDDERSEEDYWEIVQRIASQVQWEIVKEDEGVGFSMRRIETEDTYWLREDDDVPEEDRADLSTSGRQAMAKSGTAMPDGSYPIPNVTYLKKAIRAFGRAGNKPAVKAWIKKRAAALGATNLIPDSWRSEPVPASAPIVRKELKLVDNDSEDLLIALKLRGV